MGKIKCWWYQEEKLDNFGDLLTPWLIRNAFNSEPEFTPNAPGVIMGVGSIAVKAVAGSLVWGSGIMKRTNVLNSDAHWLAVRGKYTYDRVIACGGQCSEIFGDPGILLPKYYYPEINKKYKLGIIPHYVDYPLVKNLYRHHKEILIIKLQDTKVEKVIDEILMCEKTLSSSLHGIIVSHAYSIPSAWIRFSNKLGGDDVKFYDYYSAFEETPHRVDQIDIDIALRDPSDLSALANELEKVYLNITTPFSVGLPCSTNKDGL